jgi:hypothetical protein
VSVCLNHFVYIEKAKYQVKLSSIKSAFKNDYSYLHCLSVNEMAEVLPIEETFLLIFRRENLLESSVDFMRVISAKLSWKHDK